MVMNEIKNVGVAALFGVCACALAEGALPRMRRACARCAAGGVYRVSVQFIH